MKIICSNADKIMLIMMIIACTIASFLLYETRKLSHKIDTISDTIPYDNVGELVRELNEENNHGDLK